MKNKENQNLCKERGLSPFSDPRLYYERGRVSTLDISIYQCIFLLMATTLKKSSHLCMKEKNMSNVETRPH